MYKRKWIVDDASVVLFVLSVLFAFGCILACFAAGAIPDGREGALHALLDPYLPAAAQAAFDPLRLLDTVWRTVRLPLVVFLLGFTAFGTFGVPILVLADGFLSCYPLAVLYRVFGLGIYPQAALFFCFTVPIRLPVLLYLAAHGSFRILRRAPGDIKPTARPVRRSLFGVGVCLILLLVCALLQYCLIPLLLQSLAGSLPAG